MFHSLVKLEEADVNAAGKMSNYTSYDAHKDLIEQRKKEKEEEAYKQGKPLDLNKGINPYTRDMMSVGPYTSINHDDKEQLVMTILGFCAFLLFSYVDRMIEKLGCSWTLSVNPHKSLAIWIGTHH